MAQSRVRKSNKQDKLNGADFALGQLKSIFRHAGREDLKGLSIVELEIDGKKRLALAACDDYCECGCTPQKLEILAFMIGEEESEGVHRAIVGQMLPHFGLCIKQPRNRH